MIAGLIFVFSSQTYEQQTLVPIMRRIIPGEPFSELLSQIQLKYWGMTISVETRGYYYFLEFLIRKFAHLLLFGCLAVALFSVIMLTKPRKVWPVILISFIGTGLFAMFDEFHQLQTGGRTPLFSGCTIGYGRGRCGACYFCADLFVRVDGERGRSDIIPSRCTLPI